MADNEVSANVARMNRLEELWQSNRKEEAHAYARQLLSDAGQDKHVAIHCCSFLVVRSPEVDEAIDATQVCFARFRHPHLLTLMCMAYAKKGDFAAILRESGQYLSDKSLMGSALLCHGAGLLKRGGKWDASVDYFSRAGAFGKLRVDTIPASSAIHLGEFTAMGREADDPARTPITFVGEVPADAKAVVAASCDEKYYRLFAGKYRTSFFEHDKNADHVLHLHIFDPSDAFVEEMRAVNTADTRTMFSFEHTSKLNRAYYYAGRFMQMPRLMARYRMPIVMTDVDCMFKTSADEVLARAANADIGIVDTERTLFPWRNFVANLIVFNPTDAAFALASSMRNFLVQKPVESFNYWYVDQLAIAQAAYVARDLGSARVAGVRDAWRRLCFQGSGLSKEPEQKAARMDDRAAGAIAKEQAGAKRRASFPGS